VWIPESLDPRRFNQTLKNNYGITVAGGQGHLKNRIFRISHLGYYDELDMTAMVTALELTLRESGFKFDLGAGLRAAISVFAKE
jgi:aspartate aminotransferase-like enzyme